METIGLFGGTFDPIHLGHLRAAAEVRRRAGLDRVLFVPSYLPPHKASGSVVSAADRFRMVELACRRRPGLEASAIEVEAREKSYSILTLRKLRALAPPPACSSSSASTPSWRSGPGGSTTGSSKNVISSSRAGRAST